MNNDKEKKFGPIISREEREKRIKKLVEHGRECWKDCDKEVEEIQLKWRKFNPKNKRSFPQNESADFLVASKLDQAYTNSFNKDLWARSGVLYWLELPTIQSLPKDTMIEIP